MWQFWGICFLIIAQAAIATGMMRSADRLTRILGLVVMLATVAFLVVDLATTTVWVLTKHT